jgi:uncharacterized protein (TIGR02466 family)
MEAAARLVPSPACALQRVDALFASPLITLRLSDHARLDADLVAAADELRARSPGLQRSNQKGWHSDADLMARREPAFVEMRGLIADAVRQATALVAPGFDFATAAFQAEAWINVSPRHAFNAPHDHPGWAWSGSYYVALPPQDTPRGGTIEFFDPRTNVRAMTIDGADCFASKVAVTPQPGMLLIFPSYLRHFVYPNEGECDRISLAFNARFLRRPAAARPVRLPPAGDDDPR